MRIFFIIIFFHIALFGSIGSITLMKGKGKIIRATEILSAKVGQKIEEGDKLKTARDAKMQIIFHDGTIVTLGANTNYSVDSYNDTNKLHLKMTLKRGLLKTITGRIGKLAPGRFKLKTKAATIGVRGTGWRTYVGANIENSICFKGEITITTSQDFFELPAGKMILMDGKKVQIVDADVAFFNAQIEKVEFLLLQKENKLKQKTQELNEEDIFIDNTYIEEDLIDPIKLETFQQSVDEAESTLEELKTEATQTENEQELEKTREFDLTPSTVSEDEEIYSANPVSGP